jgi:hypothetical protein
MGSDHDMERVVVLGRGLIFFKQPVKRSMGSNKAIVCCKMYFGILNIGYSSAEKVMKIFRKMPTNTESDFLQAPSGIGLWVKFWFRNTSPGVLMTTLFSYN